MELAWQLTIREWICAFAMYRVPACLRLAHSRRIRQASVSVKYSLSKRTMDGICTSNDITEVCVMHVDHHVSELCVCHVGDGMNVFIPNDASSIDTVRHAILEIQEPIPVVF